MLELGVAVGVELQETQVMTFNCIASYKNGRVPSFVATFQTKMQWDIWISNFKKILSVWDVTLLPRLESVHHQWTPITRQYAKPSSRKSKQCNVKGSYSIRSLTDQINECIIHLYITYTLHYIYMIGGTLKTKIH